MFSNRKQARDLIRHKLNKMTSRDQFARFGKGANKEGEPADSHPFPSNSLINEQFDEALSLINQECNIGHVQDISVAVAATDANGAQQIPLRYLEGAGLNPGDVNGVKRIYWNDGSTTRRLWSLNRTEMDREAGGYDQYSTGFYSGTYDSADWQNREPGEPLNYWIEAYSLFLLPGASASGTLHLIAGTGILGFRADEDVIEQLPNDYHSTVWNLTAGLVAGTQANDVEMEKASARFLAMGMRGIEKIKAWNLSKDEGDQPTIGVETHRPTGGRRRR